MKTAAFHVIGTSPLLMHSTKGMEREGSSAPKMSKKKIPSAQEEAEAGTYRDSDGNLYLPCIFFRQALVSAGKGRKIGKQFATTLFKGSVFDADRGVPLVNPSTGEIIEEYAIDERPVVIGKARVLRARPRFDEWSADVLLDYDEEAIQPAEILDALTAAGKRVGVGDYRAEKGGWFGRFRVEGFTVNDD